MRCLKRNNRQFWYCLYSAATEIEDEYHNATGEYDVSYADAVQMYANISPASGQAQTEQFGNLDSYDKVIVTDDMSCPIDEHTVLFVDKAPEYPVIEPTTNTVPNTEPELDAEPDDESDDDPEPSQEPEPEPTPEPQYDYAHPKYDYIVKRVAKSLNSISIAISKVEVS